MDTYLETTNIYFRVFNFVLTELMPLGLHWSLWATHSYRLPPYRLTDFQKGIYNLSDLSTAESRMYNYAMSIADNALVIILESIPEHELPSYAKDILEQLPKED